MGKFDGKVALVTGGGSGIGRATALAFAAEGARVGVGGRHDENCRETVELIIANGGEAFAARLDVRDSASVNSFVGAVVGRYGRLDCAANIAGLPQREGGLFCTDETWNEVVGINLTGVFYCTRAEAAVMKPFKTGAIVNCSSIAGLQGSALGPSYTAAKHGVIGFTKSAALSLAADNIRVNCFCPGFTLTTMTRAFWGTDVERVGERTTPLGRASDPKEQAAAVLWLCSEEASFVTGANLAVDGGVTAGAMAYSGPPARGA